MAASAKNVGAWADSNATTQVVTLPAHAAGDMLFVVAACKPYTADPTITNPATGWTRLYTYADGTVANGNGVGSVRQVLFYREAASAAETNPTVSWGTTSAPGIAVAGVLQKGASDTWNTPLATNGNTNAATSISVSLADPGIAAGGIGLVIHTTRDNSGLTVPNWTQTGATLGTLTEWPATAISSATSNDMAGDMAYRTVTTPGTGNITATGTQGAAETGVTSIAFFGVTAAPLGSLLDEMLADSPSMLLRGNESSGTTANDSSSGGANDGTLVGNAAFGAAALVASDTSIDFDGAGDYITVPDGAWKDRGDAAFTLAWVFKLDATGAWIILGSMGSTAPAVTINPSGLLRLQDGSQAQVSCSSGTTLLTDTTSRHMVVATYDGTNGKLYLDGADVTTVVSTTVTFVDTATDYHIGSDPGGGNYLNGRMAYAAYFPSAVSAARVADWWAAIDNEPSQNVTVTLGTASLGLTAFAPTVTATANLTITPGVAALAITSQTPTVTASDHRTVTPGVASLALAPQAPTVTASDNQVAAPATAALSLAAFAPAVAVSDNVTVTPGVASLALSPLAPVVTASDHQVVTPDTAILALTPLAPSVILGTVVTPDLVAFGLTAFAPAVTASDHRLVTPGSAVLDLTTFAPGVTAGAGLTVVPGPADLALTAFASDAIVTDHVIVMPAPGLLALTAFAPDALISDHKLVTPAALALSLGLYAPSILVPAVVVPDAASLGLTAFAPDAVASDHQVVAPGTLALVLTTFAPTVTASGGGSGYGPRLLGCVSGGRGLGRGGSLATAERRLGRRGTLAAHRP